MDALPPGKVLERVGKCLSEPNLNKDALVKLLKKAETTLSDLSSFSSLQTTLSSLSCSLIQNNLLKHKDDDVRILVVVCFTEIIRLLEPNPPYSFEVFKDLFRLIVGVFRQLTDSNSLYSTRRLKILETVAYCKSFLFMLVSCEDLAAEMFDVFFKAIRCNIQNSFAQAIFLIMTNILEQKVAPRILEVILRNLLRPEKAASFRLAVSVIQNCTPKLENSVYSFLTSCMLDMDNVHKGRVTDWGCIVGNDDDKHEDIWDNDSSGAELRSSYHDIILRIYQCSPKILTSIWPCLTQELLIDQVDTRIKAVYLIGKLLVLSKLYFGQDHRSIFSEFLRRFSDKSTDVRLASLEWAKAAYQCNTSTDEARRILVAVEGRLLDFDDKVRIQAISVICNLASSSLSYFPSDLVVKTIKRLRDKKISVRKSAMHGLLELYKSYCIKCSNGLFSLNLDYERIPCGVLMLCFDKDCKEFRSQNLELVFARDLFPSSLTATDRKKHWTALFSLFTQPHLKALKFILLQKQRFQHELRAYLALRSIEKDNDSEVQIKIFESFSKMASSFLDSSKAKECFEKLHHMKDGYIFKSLQQLVDEHTSLSACSSVRVAFLERIGKKHQDYEFFRILSLRSSYTIFNAELVQCILEDILSQKCGEDKDLLCSAEIVLFIVEMFPSLLKGSENLLLKLSSDSTVLTNKKLLHILALAGHHVSIKLSDIYPFLERICLLGTRAESKFAVQAIFQLIDPSDDLTFSNLCKKLVSSLQIGQNTPTILQSLSFIARCSFGSYKPYEKQVTNLIVQNIFSSTKLNCALEETFLNGDLSCSFHCKLRIYGMKALVKSFLPNRASGVVPQIKEIMETLGNTIQGEGIIYSNISSTTEMDHLRLAAVKLILQFATRFDSYIPPKLFHVIIARSRDSSYTVRNTFISKVHGLLTENLIPVRYACAFVLASIDCIDDIRSDSVKYLSEFIGGRRRNSFNQDTSSQDEKGQIINSPEYVVVFLIHFLAHDQGFPLKNLGDEDFYPEFCSPLVIILRALVELEDFSGNASDRLSNLFAILCAIKKADDAVDTQITPKLHILSDIAILILKLLGKDLKSPSNIRRMVFLPSSFYKVYQGPRKGYDLGRNSVDENFAKKILDVVDSSILKPYTSGSKFCKPEKGAMGGIKNYSDIELNHGCALDRELLQNRTHVQPLKASPAIASVSTDSHIENADVHVSTGVYFPTQAVTTEPVVKNLDLLLTKQRIRKCGSIAFQCDQSISSDSLDSKGFVDKVKGCVGHQVSLCSPVDMSSGNVNSYGSLKRSYKVSYDDGSLETTLEAKRLESMIENPYQNEDACSVQQRNCYSTDNTCNSQTTAFAENAGNCENFNCSAIVGAKKANRRGRGSSTKTNDSSKSDLVDKNASRRTRLRRA